MINRPADMSDLESILEKNSNVYYSERWHPIAVSCFESELKHGALYGMSKEVRKNIAYSLQYLQYIQLQFDQAHLHEIIATHLIKTYIITAMGIIEAIFHHLVVSKGYQKKNEWAIQGKPVHTNAFKENGVEKKHIITTEYRLNSPEDIQMDFEYLINKVQEKKLVSLSYKAFPHIKALKRLRNKVHLHLIRYENDTDYMGISFYDYTLVRYILFLVLRDKSFSPPKETCLSFLMPTEEQMRRLTAHINENRDDEE
ncbi:MAG: hypothetical protein IKN81_03480 [Oscillospiraceae bacterium]|nr:hypothetical protein [Oscillospiraceae bacterium]